MNAFLYGTVLQFKLDIRNKNMIITCYLVPLLFFAVMGGIFTSLMPEAKDTLIQSMTVMGVSMGALIGVPASILEIYGTDIKKMYEANGMPLYCGLLSSVLSAFLHLLFMTVIIFAAAPAVFDAAIPSDLPFYFTALVLFLIVSLSIAAVLGLLVKNQAKLTMISQIVFFPSIMLSGIMFPANLLPEFLEQLGKLFPASWSYALLLDPKTELNSCIPLIVIFAIAVLIICLLLKRIRTE